MPNLLTNTSLSASQRRQYKTLAITNFGGRLTRYNNGDINSGLAKFATTFGADPFSKPGTLTWLQKPLVLDSSNSAIQDLIVTMRPRLESGITYVYAIGHTGRLYKIQVNSPSSYNPAYNNAVLLTTLTLATPLGTSSFTCGGTIQFYGSTLRIYFSHDLGVSYVNFDGTGETYINGSAGQTAALTYHPTVIFQNSLYVGGGIANIEKIDNTNTLTNTILNPGFNLDDYVKDLDVSPDGNYLQIIVSKIPTPNIITNTQDTNSLSSSTSYKFLWNGVDTGPTSYQTFNSYLINSNITFGQFNYTAGYDSGGAAVYSDGTKILSLPDFAAPNPNAELSTANMLGFASPEFSSVPPYSSIGQNASVMLYGQYDNEIPPGLYRFFRQAAKNTDGATELDIIQVPSAIIVSNFFWGPSTSGYANNQVGLNQVYFSTLETSASITAYRLYIASLAPLNNSTTIEGVYETQTELLGRKVDITEVRIYGEPWVLGNSFKLDLIGSNGNPIPNASQTFTCQSSNPAAPMYLLTDYAWYNPDCAPTYAIGVRITNLGANNLTINKIEISYDILGGK